MQSPVGVRHGYTLAIVQLAEEFQRVLAGPNDRISLYKNWVPPSSKGVALVQIDVIEMITTAKIKVANALESASGGAGGVSLELVLLLGIAAAVITILVYLFSRSRSSAQS